MAARALLKLGGACDSDCLFCHAGGQQRHRTLSTQEACARIIFARKNGFAQVVFSGGEPTTRSDIVTLFRFCQKAGVAAGLMTNGKRLAEHDLRDQLLRIGLAYANVSLHGHEAALHDNLTGTHSFDGALRATKMLAAKRIFLSVTTVVCEKNLSALSALAELVAEVATGRPDGFVLHHRLAVVEPKGKALEHRELLPDLHMASSAVEAALKVASRKHISDAYAPGYDGLPLCLAPPGGRLEDLRAQCITHMQEVDEDRLWPTDQSQRSYGKPCSRCQLRAGPEPCTGVYSGYLPENEKALRPASYQDP